MSGGLRQNTLGSGNSGVEKLLTFRVAVLKKVSSYFPIVPCWCALLSNRKLLRSPTDLIRIFPRSERFWVGKT